MTEMDLSNNQALAMRAKLSITDGRAQQLVRNWLLVHPEDQATADRNARVLRTCAQVSRTNLDEVGDWDALAHCMTVSLMMVSTEWFLNYSGYMANQPPQTVPDMVRSVFGTRFKGKPIVSVFDREGNAVKTIPSAV